jgi:thymidylate synthase
MEVRGRGVNEVFSEALQYLSHAGVEENSRNGGVISLPEPAVLTYTHPQECVLFSPLRDQNCFFTMMEFLWMISGRNDLAWPLYFNSKFGAYSDDGETIFGAYGKRWRSWFGYDQLALAAAELRANPESRRVVVSMWSAEIYPDHPNSDLWQAGSPRSKDVPCNLNCVFDLRGGKLNLTVFNRSNDAIFGALGANAVHFSLLLQYMSAWLEKPVGIYNQISSNFHAYTAIADRERLRALAVDADIHDAYKTGEVTPFPLVNTDIETWDRDLKIFMGQHEIVNAAPAYCDKFFSTVAQPMYNAWRQRKEKRGTGLEHAQQIAAPDWRKACVEWIERRLK